MTNLIQTQEKLSTIKNSLLIDLDFVNEDIGKSFTSDKFDGDQLAAKASNIKTKLNQLEIQLANNREEIEAKELAEKQSEEQKRFEARQGLIESSCTGINKAWKLQAQLSTILQQATKDHEDAIPSNDEVVLQARRMIGLLMEDCKLHFVTAAGTAAVQKHVFDNDDIERIQSGLRGSY
jgi:hypothetical protein